MFTLLLILHVIICILLIFFVLLQSGRGADLGAAFGSMGQVSYARGKMSGISIVTTGGAIIFMLTSLTLAYMSSQKAVESVVQDLPVVEKTAPIAQEKLQESQASESTGSENPTSAAEIIEPEVLRETASPSDADVPSAIMEQTDAPPMTE